MYDASFDHEEQQIGRHDRRWLWLIRLAAVAAVVGLVTADSADAQIPLAPVLQNVWATPGIVGALDIAGGADGSVYAAAASWTPGSGHFQVSGGAGYGTRTGAGSGAVYGARVALPLGGGSSSFGFAAFAGIGGGSGGTVHRVCEVPVGGPVPDGCQFQAGSSPPQYTIDSTTSTVEVPVGAAVGWRKAIGSTHGISVYGTPSYIFFSGGMKTGGLFRVAIGADAGITSSLGATLGVELGGTRPRGVGGPSGSLWGLGVSYAFGHR